MRLGEEIGRFVAQAVEGGSSLGALGMNRWKNCPKSELSVRERSTLSLWKGLRATLKLLLPLRGPEQSPILDMRAPRYAPNVPEESSNTISKIQSINKSRADFLVSFEQSGRRSDTL